MACVNFGAFVDLGGVDGLVHVSELSWKHIDHPGEVVEVGDEVTVEVLEVDFERERVSLSNKQYSLVLSGLTQELVFMVAPTKASMISLLLWTRLLKHTTVTVPMTSILALWTIPSLIALTFHLMRMR